MDFDFNASLYDDIPLVPALTSILPSQTIEKPINLPEAELAPNSSIHSPEPESAPVLTPPENSTVGVYPIELCKLFVGGLKWDTTRETFKNYFLKFGPIEDCIFMKDTVTGKSRGFGFITYEDPASLQRVLKQDHVIDGKMVDTKAASSPEDDFQKEKIFVGGLSTSVTKQMVHDYFSQFGTVLDTVIMLDKVTQRFKLINKIEIKNANPRSMAMPERGKQNRYEPYRRLDNDPEANKFREFFRPISKIEKSSRSYNTGRSSKSLKRSSEYGPGKVKSRDKYADKYSQNEKSRTIKRRDRGRDDDDAVDLTARFKR